MRKEYEVSLTDQQRAQYLYNPVFCPVCKETGDHLEWGDVEPYGTADCFRAANCETCKSSWTEIYSVTHVEVTSELSDFERAVLIETIRGNNTEKEV